MSRVTWWPRPNSSGTRTAEAVPLAPSSSRVPGSRGRSARCGRGARAGRGAARGPAPGAVARWPGRAGRGCRGPPRRGRRAGRPGGAGRRDASDTPSCSERDRTRLPRRCVGVTRVFGAFTRGRGRCEAAGFRPLGGVRPVTGCEPWAPAWRPTGSRTDPGRPSHAPYHRPPSTAAAHPRGAAAAGAGRRGGVCAGAAAGDLAAAEHRRPAAHHRRRAAHRGGRGVRGGAVGGGAVAVPGAPAGRGGGAVPRGADQGGAGHRRQQPGGLRRAGRDARLSDPARGARRADRQRLRGLRHVGLLRPRPEDLRGGPGGADQPGLPHPPRGGAVRGRPASRRTASAWTTATTSPGTTAAPARSSRRARRPWTRRSARIPTSWGRRSRGYGGHWRTRGGPARPADDSSAHTGVCFRPWRTRHASR